MPVASVRKGLVSLKVDLAIQGQEKGLRLTFPTVTRKNGEAMVAALQANAPLSAGEGFENPSLAGRVARQRCQRT